MKPTYMRISLFLFTFYFPGLIVFPLLGLSVSALVLADEPEMPGMQLISPEPMTPEEARAYEQQHTVEGTMGMMLDGGEQVEPEIAELARGLKYDPDLMYKFVYDHIEYTPIWGDVKGAYMCLMDRSGNCFDQASLLIAMLKEAEKKNGQPEAVCKVQDPHYVYGYIGIPLNQSASWLGVTANASVIGNILTYALIPHTGVTSIGHVWVKVYLDETNDGVDNGSYYVFDPSLKSHNIKARLSDGVLASAMQYEQSSFITDALAGSESGDHSIRKLNTSNISSNLALYSSNLINYIKTNLPTGTIDDIIGGKTIIPASEVPRQLMLPYELASPPTEEWTDIPPVHQTTLQIVHEGIDQTLNSSTIYGKRLTITYNGNLPQLKLDGNVLATGTAVTLGASKNLKLVFNHPYTAADRTNNISIITGYMYCVVDGWTNTGTEIIENRRRKLQEYIHEGLTGNSEEVTGESLNIIGLTWLAQHSREFYMTDQISDTTTTIYHLAGVCGQKQSPYIDLPACLMGQSSSNTSRKLAGFYTSSGLGSAVEWGVVEQLQPYTAVSTVKLLDIANNRASLPTPSYDRIFIVDSNTYWRDVLKPILASNGSYSTSELNSIENYVKSNAYRAIVPEYGNLEDGTWQGIGFLIINTSETGIWHIISGDLKGGFGSYSWNVFDNTQPIVQTKSFSQSAPAYTSTFTQDPIDLHTGSNFYEHSDISIGNDFNLAFKRTYDSISRLEDGPLGLGWKHNFHIKAEVCSDGFQAMGSDSSIDAAASIATIYINISLCMSGKSLENLMIMNLSQKWLMDQKINNIVTIKQPGNTMQFVKLPDGNFNPPPGEAAKLTTQPDGSYLLKTKHGEYLDFDPNGRIAAWSDPNNSVSFSYGVNGKLSQVSNGLGRSLTFTYDTNDANHIARVTDSAGRIVRFAYSTKGNLIRVTDANNFITTFVYDPNNDGRMTQVYYPTEPNNPYVTNIYDSLGHVKTQTNADGFTYQYYYTGYRTEEADPCNYSNIYNFNDYGRLITQTNPLGNQTTYQYDGQLRKTLITYPQGNSSRYIYDSNHNVLQSIQIPAAGSGDPNIVETFTYEPNFNRVTTYTDPNGKITTSQYYSNGKVRQIDQPIVDGDIPRTLFTYNSHGQTQTVTDPEGMVTKNQYDPNGNLISTIVDYGDEPNKLNITATMTYNAVGDVNSTTDPRGNKTTYQYDSMRRLIKTTSPAPFNYITTYEYYPDGTLKKLSRQTDTGWQVTSYTYTPSSKIETVTDPNGNVTEYEYDALDRLWKTTDAENNTTTQLYDAAGRLWKVIDANDNNSVIYSYYANGNIETLTDAKGNTTTYQYDGHNRLKKTIFPNSTFEQLTYNIAGNISQKQTRGGQIISYGYDTLNRLKTKTLPGPQQIQYTYDLTSRTRTVTDVSGTIQHNYDRIGRLTDVTCPDGKSVSYQYDAAGNRTALTYPDGNGINYTYDQLNRLVNIRTNNFDDYTRLMLHCNAIPFADEMGHAVTNNNVTLDAMNLAFGAGSAFFNGTSSYLTFTDSDDWSFGAGDFTIDFRVRFNNITGSQFFVSQWIDGNNRFDICISDSKLYIYSVSGAVPVAYYVMTSAWSGLDTNTWYHLAFVRTGTTAKIFIDGVSQPLTEFIAFSTLPDLSASLNIGRYGDGSYYFNGQIDEFRISKGIARWTSNFTPPSAEYVISGKIVEYSYDALSRRTGAQFANGTSATYSYNTADRLLSLNNQLVGASRSFAYSYDKVGNRQTMTTDGTNLHQYNYDKIYQLKGVDYPAGFFVSDTTFNYDLAGNRSSVIAGGTTNYAANNLNQYTSVSGIPYSYNNNGNLTNDGNNTYSYDAENRLISAATPAGSVVYQYDAFGKRIGKTINGQVIKYFYDGDQIICEYNDDGILLRKYVYGTGIDEVIRMSNVLPSADIVKNGVVDFGDYAILAESWLLDSGQPGFNPNADLMPDGVIDYKDLEVIADNWLGTGCSNGDYYYHYDGLGSVIALSDDSGHIAESYFYDVYGKPSNTSSVGNVYMFTGRQYDPETGNYYYRARYYSPTLGRFLQTDPIGYKGGINLYLYCGNNPIVLIDTFGLCAGTMNWGSFFTGSTSAGNFGQSLLDGATLAAYGASLGFVGDKQYVSQLQTEYGGVATFSKWSGGASSASLAAAYGIAYLGLDVTLGGTGEAINNLSGRGGIGPIQIGQAGENAVGIYGPKTRINVNGVFRIPDQVTDTVLREVKNVQNLSYTKQLRDYADFAQQKGLDFELYTRTSTQMSVPLNEAINNGVIIHNYIPGM